MSNLSKALVKIAKKNAVKSGKLAKKTQLGKKRLGRILSGEKRPSDRDFKRLVKAITIDQLDQAHLVAARMLDVCNGPGKELVSIQIKGEKPGTS